MHVTINNVFGVISDKSRDINVDGYTMHIVSTPAFILRKAEKIKFLVDSSSKRDFEWRFQCNLTHNPIPKGSSIHIVQPCKYSMNDIRKHYTIKRSSASADYVVFGEAADVVDTKMLNLYSCIIDTKAETIVASYRKCSSSELEEEYKKIINKVECPPVDYYQIDNRFYGYTSEEYWRVYTNTLNKPYYPIESLDITNENELTSELLYMIYKTNQNDWTQENEDNLIVLLNTLNNTDWRNNKDVVGAVLCFTTESYWNSRAKNYKKDILANMRIQKSKYPKQITELLMLKGTSVIKNKTLLKSFLEHILNIGEKKFTDFMSINSKLYENYIPAWMFAKCYNVICKITPANEES